MDTAPRTSKWKIVALAVFIAGAMVASFFLPVDKWSAALAEWGEDFGWSGALLAGLLFVPACVFVLPATLLTYALGFAFGFWPALVGVELGALLGAVVVFGLGRTLARDWIQDKAKERPKLAALDEVIDEGSFGLLFLIRLSPLFPYGLVGYMLGATRASFWRHLVATALAILPQVAVTCWIGAQLSEFAQNVGSERERSPLEYALLVLGAVVAIVVLVVISKRTRSALDAKLEQA